MTRRSKIRLAVAVFILVNAGGAVYAAALGEGIHTAVHVALLLGTYAVWRVASRAPREDAQSVHSAEAHLEQLEQSVDAIALEVERIGEAQRFMVKLQQERAEKES